jgi:hypothetical protein
MNLSKRVYEDSEDDNWISVLPFFKDEKMVNHPYVARILLPAAGGDLGVGFNTPYVDDASREAYFQLLVLLRESGLLKTKEFWGPSKKKEFLEALTGYVTGDASQYEKRHPDPTRVLTTLFGDKPFMTITLSDIKNLIERDVSAITIRPMLTFFACLWKQYKIQNDPMSPSLYDNAVSVFYRLLRDVEIKYDTFKNASHIMTTVVAILGININDIDDDDDEVLHFWAVRFLMEQGRFKPSLEDLREACETCEFLKIEYYLDNHPDMFHHQGMIPVFEEMTEIFEHAGMTTKRAQEIIKRVFEETETEIYPDWKSFLDQPSVTKMMRREDEEDRTTISKKTKHY